jgi:Immunoglobulin-like domain of bacterial spore germination
MTLERRRGRLLIALLVAVVLAVGVTIFVVTRADQDDEAAKVSTRTESTTTTQPQTTTTPITADTSTAVWPIASTTIRYHDPVSAARGFAVDYVGFVDPVVGEFRAGDSRSGEVDVQRAANGPVTTVLVRQLGTDGTWWVLGSQTANIAPSAPTALEAISSPVTLRGMSTAFEATVNVEIREDGNGQPLARTILMGGSNGEMGPYDTPIAFTAPHASLGAVVLLTISPEDGRVAEATVVRVKFAPA